MIRLIRLGLLYGVLGFCAGFVFGVLRELVLIPNFGEALGGQIEFPMVTAAVALIGAWMGRHFGPGHSNAWLVGLGVIGVLTLLVIESSFALAILQQPLDSYLQAYDLSTGSKFPFGLAVMAAIPLISRLMESLERPPDS